MDSMKLKRPKKSAKNAIHEMNRTVATMPRIFPVFASLRPDQAVGFASMALTVLAPKIQAMGPSGSKPHINAKTKLMMPITSDAVAWGCLGAKV